MKITNNIALTGFDGVLTQQVLTDKTMEVFVPADSVFTLRLLHLKGDIDLKIILGGDRANCDVKIVYLSNKNNIDNIKVEVIHQHKNTLSRQMIKGVLTDRARLVFDGIIRIPKDSQKCDGQQNHRAVLLSDTASVKATPELEIYADDVKCAHGSAVGPLDKQTLFYLQSRGLDADTAQRLLIQAFLADALPDSWQVYIEEWMEQNVQK